jgi:aquaporin Z
MRSRSSRAADRPHWREYAIEGWSLAAFMVSALLVTAALQHPASPLAQAITDPVARRALTGTAMGLTLAAIVYSPWGQRSGAHLNPFVTLTFFRLGRVSARDALGYVAAQFSGAAVGVLAIGWLLRDVVAHPAVNYVATLPGRPGSAAAFAGEAVISFGMMATLLVVSNQRYAIARFTGVVAACLVAAYITVEAPLSGMSMNPARSLAPAIAAGAIRPLWIYFTAPAIGMFGAAELYVRLRGRHAVRCAKLQHPASGFCHFNCGRTS